MPCKSSDDPSNHVRKPIHPGYLCIPDSTRLQHTRNITKRPACYLDFCTVHTVTTLTTLTILNTPTKVTNLTTLTFRLIKGKQEVNCGSHIVYFVLLCLISAFRLYI